MLKKHKITQAFIFAAGRGERMRPLTDNLPKPLALVKNKAIIDYSIEKLLANNNFSKIIVNGFHLSKQISDHLKNFNNPRLVFSQEIEKIETGGGLLFAKDKIDFNQPLLIINGDILWQDGNQSDIDFICDNYFKYDCDILLGLKKIDEYFGFDQKIGDFNLDDDGTLRKDSNLDFAYVGVGVINPKILLNQYVKDFGKCFSLSKIFKLAIDENHKLKNIKGIELKGKYYHIGDIKSLEKINSQDHL